MASFWGIVGTISAGIVASIIVGYYYYETTGQGTGPLENMVKGPEYAVDKNAIDEILADSELKEMEYDSSGCHNTQQLSAMSILLTYKGSDGSGSHIIDYLEMLMSEDTNASSQMTEMGLNKTCPEFVKIVSVPNSIYLYEVSIVITDIPFIWNVNIESGSVIGINEHAIELLEFVDEN